jgi:hypothetical protein
VTARHSGDMEKRSKTLWIALYEETKLGSEEETRVHYVEGEECPTPYHWSLDSVMAKLPLLRWQKNDCCVAMAISSRARRPADIEKLADGHPLAQRSTYWKGASSKDLGGAASRKGSRLRIQTRGISYGDASTLSCVTERLPFCRVFGD